MSDANNGNDLVDVTIIDAAFGSCDFSLDGYPFNDVFATGPDVTQSALGVLSGSYDVYARCNNVSSDCLFTLTWQATY